MVDLTPYQAGIMKVWNDVHIRTDDPRTAFQNELGASGFEVPNVVELGRIKRIADPMDKGLKKTGWYIYNEFADNNGNVLGVGIYGSWRGEPEKIVWTSRKGMSQDERYQYSKAQDEARAQWEIEQKRIYNETAIRAFDIWQGCADAADNEYLKRKKCGGYGVRFSRGDVVVPVCFEGQISSLQFIKSDGQKKFLTGGRTKGCYHYIEGDCDTIYIAEGYATGATVHEATGKAVYVCFNAGNIYEVAVHVKAAHGNAKIIIAGDDDRFTDGNPGRTKATQAAIGLQIGAVFPDFIDGESGTDFNDIGVERTASILNDKPEIYKQDNKKPDIDIRPGGILGEIVDYYNSTSGNKQPLFAIQTALALASVVCARHYETNIENLASLFLINITKSGTGKEHAKKVIEKILDAANLERLISGDGYTSASAVFSALQARPRHITIIDEFSKYLQAAQNKYGSSHLAEANNQLMQAYGRLNGTARPRSYATLGLKDDQKKKMNNMRVVYPAVTLLAMTTPDDMFKTIDIGSIKDGFINRFVICISDEKRAKRVHREPIDVPQSIIDWVKKIQDRADGGLDDSEVRPTTQKLVITTDAMDMQDEFQQYCIDMADKMEKLGMSELTARSNENALRIALIHALGKNPNAVSVTSDDMAFGIDWVKFNLSKLIDALKMTIASSEFEGYKKETLKAIRASGEKGITWAQMQKTAPMSKYRVKDLKEILTALEDADLVMKEPYSEGRGRPTMIYRGIA